MSQLPESSEEVVSFVARLRKAQRRLVSYSDSPEYVPSATLIQEWSNLYGITLLKLACVRSWPDGIGYITTLFVEWCDAYTGLNRERYLAVADNLRPLVNAMRITIDDSILEHNRSRNFVWLPMGKEVPRLTLGSKVHESWTCRVTRKTREIPAFALDGSGSEIKIYKVEVMPKLYAYHWYIAAYGRRVALARGISESLEWAAEEVYRSFFGLMTDALFARANTPARGKEVIVFGNWIPESGVHPQRILEMRGTEAFVVDHPSRIKDRLRATITAVEGQFTTHRPSDPMNYTLEVHNRFILSGMNWYIYKPEQYIDSAETLQCRQCKQLSGKAFDIRWVQGAGPLCGPSRDRNCDQGFISEADFD